MVNADDSKCVDNTLLILSVGKLAEGVCQAVNDVDVNTHFSMQNLLRCKHPFDRGRHLAA